MKRLLVALALSALPLLALATSGGQPAPINHGGQGGDATGIGVGVGIGMGGAGGAGGSGGAGGAGGLGTGGAGGAGGNPTASATQRTYALGAPSSANGLWNCEVVLPVIGGNGLVEREACVILRDARAVHDNLAPGDERDAVVKDVLCNRPLIAAAYARTGRPCAPR